jgi:predicted amidohydrolase
MKLGLLQYNPIWEDKESNKQKILSFVEKAEDKIDLLILPEMSLTGFTMNSEQFAEGIGGDTFRFFSALAIEKSFDVFVGIIERGKQKPFNTLLHISSKGRLVKLYRKVHPFSFSKENVFYNAGSKPVTTKIKKYLIGLSICYDLRFPELYRKYAKKKAHLIVDIANWPATRIEHWRTLLKARAIENQCYVAGVNRVGDDPKLHYNGCTSFYDPMGNLLAEVVEEEKLLIVEMNKNYINEVREKFPFLDDIRMI